MLRNEVVPVAGLDLINATLTKRIASENAPHGQKHPQHDSSLLELLQSI